MMHLIYTIMLGFYAQKTDVNISKTDKCNLNIFIMVIVDCLVIDKLRSI